MKEVKPELLKCIECGKVLEGLPLYNNKDDKYPESLLFCTNGECIRFGLLTVTFVKRKEKK